MNAMDQTASDHHADHALRMWLDVRRTQTEASMASGRAQEGRRSAVTGGRHMDAVHHLVVDEIHATGATGLHIHKNRGATLPGFYRATKSWDLVLLQGEVPVLAMSTNPCSEARERTSTTERTKSSVWPKNTSSG